MRYLAVVLFVPALLLADRRGLVPQLALGAATAAFLFLFARRSRIEGRQIIAAILIATTGEIVLSLGWGLYTYRNALIPLFVPFGHGVFYALAAESARQPWLQERARGMARGVLVAGSIIAAIGFFAFHDQWGLLWWIVAAALLIRSRNQLLLSTCFIFTTLLEWLGTAIGTWHWAAIVPGVGLHSANPPSGVGILYILLDLITVAVCGVAATRGHAETLHAQALEISRL
ncbi:MAG TPA: hypothetical protein VLV78_06955 [Thermoanaerobaculia bacterium]|nr:hypothetical protein [Thermoanaerobaculia bacterium]